MLPPRNATYLRRLEILGGTTCTWVLDCLARAGATAPHRPASTASAASDAHEAPVPHVSKTFTVVKTFARYNT